MTYKGGDPSEAPSRGLSDKLPRRRLHFHSESLAGPFRELPEGSVPIGIDSVVHLDDGTTLQYWTVDHHDPEQLLQLIESVPTTLEATLLRSVADRHWFEVHGSADALFAAFDEFGGVTRSATYDADGVTVVAEFPTGVETNRVLAAVQEEYPDLELVDSYTVETVDAFRQQVKNRLTERQRTVLQTAYVSGYYEQPRRRTGTELADSLGISKQAFHDHLRKAHATVFEILYDTRDIDT